MIIRTDSHSNERWRDDDSWLNSAEHEQKKKIQDQRGPPFRRNNHFNFGTGIVESGVWIIPGRTERSRNHAVASNSGDFVSGYGRLERTIYEE